MTTPGPQPTPPPAEPVIPISSILAPDANPITPWERWRKFWFSKADPTTLGFIRLCTGLLVLYIHFAYSLDLQAFFGKHGWYGQDFINRERVESPHFQYPVFSNWNEPFGLVQLSEFPHRRKAFIEFMRGLPAEANDRKLALRYLNRIDAYENSDQFRLAVQYVEEIKPQGRHNALQVLTGGSATADTKAAADGLTAQYKMKIPPFFQDLSTEERVQLAAEISAFLDAINRIKFSDEASGRDYVFHYFYEAPLYTRRAVIEFLNKLPEDAEQRAKLIDYVAYWNADPSKAFRIGNGIFSLWFHLSDPTEMALAHAGVLIAIFLFTIGLFTRVTSVLVWVLTVGYIHRSQQILFGMDTMMNILLIYLMIGNSGAALSVDRLIARYRAARASLRRSGTIDPTTRAFLAYPPPSVMSGFGLRLIQVHFCFIYMAAGLSKLKGGSWWDGRAFWDVIANPEFTMMTYSWYEYTLHWMASVRPLYHVITISAVWLTLFTEIGCPFLLWTRLRWFMILLATSMHAVIGVLMGLNLFELLMIIMLVAFFPDRVIRDRFRGGVNLARLLFTFNPQNPRHEKAAGLALATDIDNQIALNPDRNAAEVSVSKGEDGKPETGLAGVAALFQHLRLLSVLGFVLWVPGIKSLLAKRLFLSSGGGTIGAVLKPPAPTRR